MYTLLTSARVCRCLRYSAQRSTKTIVNRFAASANQAMSTGKRTERTVSQENVLRHPSTKRAKEIDAHPPYEELKEHIKKQNSDSEPRNVLHWFRSTDLRVEDNRALSFASEKAREGNGVLIGVFMFSPADLEWHGRSPAKMDFELENLRILKDQLADMNIPLVFLTVETRSEKTKAILDFVKEHDVSHVFANIEYEIDELRRDIDVFKNLDAIFELHQDQTIIEPGELTAGTGGPRKVFTPYHRDWLSVVGSHPDLLDPVNMPKSNSESAKETLKGLFGSAVPDAPQSLQFSSKEERDRIRKLWPAGHKAATERLEHFLQKKVKTYLKNRSLPATDNSSRLSPYFASGVLSVRTALASAWKANGNSNFTESGNPEISSWVREIVFREFYRHMMVITPHNAMNLPQNLKFDFVKWEDDEEGWKKWCEGKTGMPFVDAGMRQLNHEAYMHNRLRMNVSSYLSRNLLIDYRRGERYFVDRLIDWDLCNNTQGWEPSFTIFNPVIQAEKCDPDGDYIRKWVPELKDIQGKAIFDPFNRLSKKEFEKLGYPQPHVDFKESKERCSQRMKRDMADADP